jgi:mannosyltransferase
VASGVARASRRSGLLRAGVGVELSILIGLIGLAAAIRFLGIGAQSYWYDESVTVHIVSGSFSDLVHAIPRSESTPPLYYGLAWLWGKGFGTGEAGLRSLSAVVGTATVPIVWAAARELISARAALVAAALATVSPTLVWYSQEARAYVLLVLLGALSFWFFVRARRDGRPRDVAGWGVASALALLTHYFAVFLIAPEAIGLWLVVPRERRRALLLAAGGVVAVGLALLPLAHRQEADGRTSWITGIPIGDRIEEIAREVFTSGTSLVTSAGNAPHGQWGIPALALVLAGVGLLVLRGSTLERRGALVAALIGGAAVLLPLALSFTSLDYFKDRNLLAAWPVVLIGLGAGFAAARAGWWGPVLAGLLCAICLVVDVQVYRDTDLQRTDWRGLGRALGPPREARALLVQPTYGTSALAVYGHPTGPLLPGSTVREVDVVGQLPATLPPTVIPSGLRLVERRRIQQVTLLRFRGAAPVPARDLTRSGVPFVLEVSQSANAWVAAYVRRLRGWHRAVSKLSGGQVAVVPSSVRRDLGSVLDVRARFARLPPELPNVAPLYPRLLQAAAQAEELGTTRGAAEISQRLARFAATIRSLPGA